MNAIHDFDNIRPFNDDEINAELHKISKEAQLIIILKELFPQRSRQDLELLLNSFHSVRDFQVTLIRSIVKKVMRGTTAGVTISGLESIKELPNCLFISNHRDIVLDAAFLNVLLVDNGRETCEIAIGDNLFVAPWVERLVRINKSIVVKRNLQPRPLLEASNKLSAYIRYAVTEKKSSVWIAQREGRAKNSDDRTQESLLKMLNMSGSSDFLSNFKELNIAPITISYEFDPCDYLKAQEFQQKRDNPDHKKTPEDDQLNMVTGIRGWKGRVHYEVSNLASEIENLTAGNKNEQLKLLAELIDKFIHRDYVIYPVNMVAYDMLNGTNVFAGKYTEKEKNDVRAYFQKQLNKINLANKDNAFLLSKILEMYANPLINYLHATEN